MSLKYSVVIAEPVRTAVGTFGGSLKDIPAVELGATAITAALQRSGLRPEEIGTVVMGNAVQAGNKMNPARQAAIHGGLPVQVPAMTVNRVCGSGAQAIVSAAQEILMSSVESAVAGGMENMDAAPYTAAGGVTAWATESFTTACCATGSTMRSRMHTRAGIRKIW
jgi:acetyl-CoA C-acetyltransferase